jgi:hypothetical protein
MNESIGETPPIVDIEDSYEREAFVPLEEQPDSKFSASIKSTKTATVVLDSEEGPQYKSHGHANPQKGKHQQRTYSQRIIFHDDQKPGISKQKFKQKGANSV